MARAGILTPNTWGQVTPVSSRCKDRHMRGGEGTPGPQGRGRRRGGRHRVKVSLRPLSRMVFPLNKIFPAHRCLPEVLSHLAGRTSSHYYRLIGSQVISRLWRQAAARQFLVRQSGGHAVRQQITCIAAVCEVAVLATSRHQSAVVVQTANARNPISAATTHSPAGGCPPLLSRAIALPLQPQDRTASSRESPYANTQAPSLIPPVFHPLLVIT